MARIPFPTNSEFPYHITGRTHNGEKFPIPMSELWPLMGDRLGTVGHAFELRIHAFVLMSNHFHLLAAAPNQNLSKAMGYFQSETAKDINRICNKQNQLWGRRFYRSEIRTEHYFGLAFKYVHRNPVTANIVDRCEDYQFTSLHSCFGHNDVFLSIVDDTLVDDPVGTLKWLNQAPTEQNLLSVKKALRRKVFELPKIDSRLNPLEFDTL